MEGAAAGRVTENPVLPIFTEITAELVVLDEIFLNFALPFRLQMMTDLIARSTPTPNSRL